MQELLPLAEQVAARLVARKETLAVAESSVGGLISAALLAVPGASSYFLGGSVVYTRQSRALLLGISEADMAAIRPATQPYALLLARTAQRRFGSTWALAETGATGPSGNRYGDPAGHACFAVAGAREKAVTLETGSADRRANMRSFGRGALTLLLESLPE
jgi:PncC family amidohydrolase